MFCGETFSSAAPSSNNAKIPRARPCHPMSSSLACYGFQRNKEQNCFSATNSSLALWKLGYICLSQTALLNLSAERNSATWLPNCFYRNLGDTEKKWREKPRRRFSSFMWAFSSFMSSSGVFFFHCRLWLLHQGPGCEMVEVTCCEI